MSGFAWVRILIAGAILVVLGILARQVYSGSHTPLRTIRIGSDIVVHCKAREAVLFTGFLLGSGEAPKPFVHGYLGLAPETAVLPDEPPSSVPLRLRFAIHKVDDMSNAEGGSQENAGRVGVRRPRRDGEIPFGDDVLEYVHTSGKVELNVYVRAGRLVIQYRKPD